MMENTRELLKRTRERLEDPESWCKSFYAQDAEYAAVGTFNPAACRWCLLGALSLSHGPMRMNLNGLAGTDAYDEAVELMSRRLGYIPGDFSDVEANVLANFNDRSTTQHGMILALIDDTLRLD